MGECVACGRRLSNDVDAPNVAHWTEDRTGWGGRLPYCGDSPDCQRDAERMVAE
jgi:hypothetical protein